MLSGITSIHFHTDLLLPPIPEFAIKESQITGLYNKLREPPHRPYQNLELQADPPTLSTRHGNGRSCCQIGADKIRIEEDGAGTVVDCDEFIETVEAVLKSLGPNPGPFFGQRCVIRCTAQPNRSPDSLHLLAGKLGNVLTTIDPFGRPPSFFGVRFRFQPHDGQGHADDAEAGEPPPRKKRNKRKAEAIEHKGFLTVRFETYSQDMKKVWMEVDGQYLEEIIQAQNIAEVSENIRRTYRFITENSKAFLDQFDKADDSTTEKP